MLIINAKKASVAAKVAKDQILWFIQEDSEQLASQGDTELEMRNHLDTFKHLSVTETNDEIRQTFCFMCRELAVAGLSLDSG